MWQIPSLIFQLGIHPPAYSAAVYDRPQCTCLYAFVYCPADSQGVDDIAILYLMQANTYMDFFHKTNIKLE